MTFDIDANGIVNVTAVDKGTGKAQNITITSSTNLSEEEINRRVHEAEQYEAEDRKKKDLIEAKNQAESLIYQTENTMKEAAGTIDEGQKKAVQEKLEELKTAKDSDNIDEMKAKSEALLDELNKVSQAMYQKAADAQANAGPQAGSSAGAKDDVVDADYEVVDDDDEKKDH